MRKVVIIPAKATSERIAEKNWRPFAHGQSLVEIKVQAGLASTADLVIVSTEREQIPSSLQLTEVIIQRRSAALCRSHVNLRELFSEVLSGFENDIVFWAHPTSPFISPLTISHAMETAERSPGKCVLGVKECHEFLWNTAGPLNYDPSNQPRSQDLAPIYFVTGGVHCALGRDFLKAGAVSFSPAVMINLKHPENVDINELSDWHYAQWVAEQQNVL